MTVIRRTTIDDALEHYLEASKSRTVVVGPLQKHLILHSRKSDRRIDVLHPSEVVAPDWCPRYSQMVIEGAITPATKDISFRLASIFAEGHAIHDKWQQWLGGMGVLYGVWRCTSCRRTAWSLGPPDNLCKHPDCVVYAEVPLQSGLWAGHADGIVCMEKGDYLLEVKSIGTGTIRHGDPSLLEEGDDLSSAFTKISHPFDNHLLQVQIYMELTQRMADAGDPEIRPVDNCVVIYECKSDQAVKEFVVRRDPSYIRDILEYADEMEALLGTGTYISCPFRECKYHD